MAVSSIHLAAAEWRGVASACRRGTTAPSVKGVAEELTHPSFRVATPWKDPARRTLPAEKGLCTASRLLALHHPGDARQHLGGGHDPAVKQIEAHVLVG